MTDQPASLPARGLRAYAGITLRGFLMGLADVVPGVSGGTIAFITGIYEELINSIKVFSDIENLRLILAWRWREALRVLPWPFLVALGLGVGAAILTAADGINWLLERHPVYVWAFFFGLVLASIATIAQRLKQWTVARLAWTAGMAVAAYWLVGLVPVQTPNDWWFLILSGAIAICAMILPGISGAYVLVLLGKYGYVLDAVIQRDIGTILLVGLGCAIGIVTFARVVSYLFQRYHDATVAALTGLMIGSLRKMWPWKETLRSEVDPRGHVIPIEEINVLPTGFSAEFMLAVGLMLLGLGLVVGLNWYAARHAGSGAQQSALTPESVVRR
jgi:putative membrane protein